MRAQKRPTVAIIGLGMWGEKLVRVATSLHAVVHGYDLSAAQRRACLLVYPNMVMHTSVAHIMNDPSIDAVVIATPPKTHFSLAKKALRAHKHVLIEKPMTQTTRSADTLCMLAATHNRSLMVDHTYLFSPAIQKAKNLISMGAIGALTHIHSIRAGNHVRTDSDMLWDLAPHDVAISQFFYGTPISVRTTMQEQNTTNIELFFTGRASYTANISWNQPVKQRILTFTGTTGKIRIVWKNTKEMLYVAGSRKPIQVDTTEPLEVMVRYFFQTFTQPKRPHRSDGKQGREVVRIITLLHASIHSGRTI